MKDAFLDSDTPPSSGLDTLSCSALGSGSACSGSGKDSSSGLATLSCSALGSGLGAKALASSSDSCEKEALFFKALAHPTRLFIVKQLAIKEHCVCEIVDMLDFKFATISQHLSVLKNAGIVSVDKRGKEVYYTLNCPCIMELFDCISNKA